MRESFGGAFMIKLVLVFIVVYISFMAVAVNYAKAFRVKNRIIDVLEQYQYHGSSSSFITSKGEPMKVLDYIDNLLGSFAYNIGQSEELAKKCTDSGGDWVEHGTCIIPMTNGETASRYYRVVVYIKIDFPFFDLHLTLPITGETKSMREWSELTG